MAINNSINIYRIVTSHLKLLNIKDHDKCCWKSRSWLETSKTRWRGFFLLYVIIYSKTHVSKPLNYHRTSAVGLIVVKSLVLCLVCYKSLFVVLFFSCDRCIDCPSSICSFWLPFWYLQSFPSKYLDNWQSLIITMLFRLVIHQTMFY